MLEDYYQSPSMVMSTTNHNSSLMPIEMSATATAVMLQTASTGAGIIPLISSSSSLHVEEEEEQYTQWLPQYDYDDDDDYGEGFNSNSKMLETSVDNNMNNSQLLHHLHQYEENYPIVDYNCSSSTSQNNGNSGDVTNNKEKSVLGSTVQQHIDSNNKYITDNVEVTSELGSIQSLDYDDDDDARSIALDEEIENDSTGRRRREKKGRHYSSNDNSNNNSDEEEEEGCSEDVDAAIGVTKSVLDWELSHILALLQQLLK